MEYFNKMDGAGGYVRASLLGLSQGVSPLHDPLRLHPALHSQITCDKDALLRPLADYPPLQFLPFTAPPFLPHHLDPRLPFNPSAFHPLHKLNQTPSSNSNTCNISSTLPCSAFAPLPSKVPKLQADSSPIFSHTSLLSSLDQRNAFLSGPSPPASRTTFLEDRRDSPSPRGSNGSRDSPGQIRESSTPTSPDESRVRKTIPLGDPWCPVCGMTLRPGEVESHFTLEIEKLARISQSRHSSQRSITPTSTGGTILPNSHSHSPNIPPLMRSRDAGWETFQRVKANRQIRLRTKKRKTGRGEEASCPLCNDRVSASTPEEFQSHLDRCFRQASILGILQQNVIEEEDVDVEGDSYDDLDWLANRRGRTAAMLRAQQIQAKENEMEVTSEKEVTSATPEKGMNSCDTASPDGVNSTKEETKQIDALEKEAESLRDKVKVLEKTLKSKYMCNVCKGDLDRPSVSLKCFHVSCEGCWPRSINNTGECPTCSEIYSVDDIKIINL